jgi:hypothetical protein
VEVAGGQVEVEGGSHGRRGSWSCVVLSSPGPPLYVGVEGCTLAPSPSHKGGSQGGEKGGSDWGGADQAGPKTLTLAGHGQGLRRPLLPSLDGLLSKNTPIRCFPIFNYLISINSFN